MIRRLAGSWLALGLAACTTTAAAPEPRILYRDVDKAVATSCVPAETPAAPTVPTSEQIARLPTPQTRQQAIYGAFLAWEAWGLKAGPVLAGCR